MLHENVSMYYINKRTHMHTMSCIYMHTYTHLLKKCSLLNGNISSPRWFRISTIASASSSANLRERERERGSYNNRNHPSNMTKALCSIRILPVTLLMGWSNNTENGSSIYERIVKYFVKLFLRRIFTQHFSFPFL